MNTMQLIQTATLAARARLGDYAISTNVKAGKFQVCRVTYPNGASSHVAPLTEYLTLVETLRTLRTM